VAKNQLVGLNMSVAAQRPGEPSATSNPVFAASAPFPSHGFVFTLNGTDNANVESFALNIRNDIEAVYTLSGKRYCHSHYLRALDVSGSVTLEFESEAERRRMWGALAATGPQNVVEPGTLAVAATHDEEAADGAPFFFGINIPELCYESAPANISVAHDRILQKITFKPAWNRAAGEVISIALRNRTTSYPDPA